MKRTALLVMTAILFGCNGSESTVEPVSPTEPLTPNVASKSVSPIQPEIDFATGLAKLTTQANDLESELRFDEAAETWKQIDEMVSEKYGPQSWQAANAKLAGIMASKQADFDEAQLGQLKEMQSIQQQIREAFSAGDVAKAKSLNERSTRITKRLFGKQSPLYGKQLLQNASLNRQTGRFQDAIRDYHQAIETLKDTFRSKHPDIQAAHRQLGQLYLARRKYVPAIENLKESTRMAANLWGEESIQYANEANELGVAYQKSGQTNIARGVFKASEVIRRKKLGPNHPAIAHSHLNLGTVSMESKDYLAATQHLSHAIEVFQKQRKPPENFINLAKSRLSTVHMLTGQPALAEPLLGEVVQASYTTMGEDAPQVAEFQFRLGVALAKQGKYDQAEPMFRKALVNQKKNLGDENASTLQTMKAIAVLLKQTKRVTESEQMIQEIHRLSQASSSTEFQR